jgi:hypothetical protein
MEVKLGVASLDLGAGCLVMETVSAYLGLISICDGLV